MLGFFLNKTCNYIICPLGVINKLLKLLQWQIHVLGHFLNKKVDKQVLITCIKQWIIRVVFAKIIDTNTKHWTQNIRAQIKHHITIRPVKHFSCFFVFFHHPDLSSYSQVFVCVRDLRCAWSEIFWFIRTDRFWFVNP